MAGMLVMGLGVCCAGKTITVDDFGAANYSRIQYAITSAVDGDEIVVMDGTYTGVGNRDLIQQKYYPAFAKWTGIYDYRLSG